MTATVLDVLDNFLTHRQTDVQTAPGTVIHELGEEVQKFAAARQVKSAADRKMAFLGGWPSANFWAVGGDMLLTSLLYSDRLLVRDPIVDWFSLDQYSARHKMAARLGYLDSDGRPNISATRGFLASVVPQLDRWRPLIESGVVVLTAAEDHALTFEAEIRALQGALEDALLLDPVVYSEQFSATDITVEDNLRGMFVFAGGDQVRQLRKAQADGLYHFAREYLLAATNGATYTAPFRHERYLCRHGIGQTLLPSERVASALLSSKLPIFSGLTPAVVSKIHADDSFAVFRRQLHETYQNLPVEESDQQIQAYVRDQEKALLTPTLQAAERSADRGILRRLGLAVTDNFFGLATAVAAGVMLKDPATVTAVAAGGILAQALVRGRTETSSAAPIWTELVKHQRSAQDEMIGVRVENAEIAAAPKWGIPAMPSMEVTVSAGQMLIDHLPRQQVPVAEPAPGDFQDDNYRLCSCGSGRKFKFCCQPLERFPPQHIGRPQHG
ncbi:SEC-C domain-containing protein [Kribbella antibiotica]|uniref:SEC-C domain-containing protein n=1 Tax=Kribbella antibiotica TaxID=190195 RepID=A0A4R4ZH98_9ACTN|nr:SEC-C domain-containing protein [Kribbella antibiotica]TDD58018.1 SEC-C domain-containing protein [Kribbella antibiotica]